jgi:hypothetical protein
VTLDRRSFSFWRIVGGTPSARLVGLHGAFALVVGGSGGYLFATRRPVEEHVKVAGDYLSITAALVGVVFAGFALVIALLSDRYLVILEQVGGVRKFLEPFLITIGMLVGGLLATVAFRATATLLPAAWKTAAFTALTVWFVYTVLDIVVLAKGVLAHGATRAEVAVVEDLQRQVDGRPDRGRNSPK